MWSLPKISMSKTKVLSVPINSELDIKSGKTESCRSDAPVNEAVAVPASNGRRSMKKSREERFTDDVTTPTILPKLPTLQEIETIEVTPQVEIEYGEPSRLPLAQIDSKLSDISNVKFLCKGSHSRVFKGIYQNKVIIIKVLADSSVNKPIAQMEFKLEKDILSRISHPNVLSIIGVGEVSSKLFPTSKRPLMILEALTGGTLSYHLNKYKQEFLRYSDGSCSSLIHDTMPFNELQFIRLAKEFADALYYLHEKFSPNCTLIHRDLKPDNIGFSEDGSLKLMDFGLSCTVKKNSSETDVYELSGCTGSYRYMAPEVALNKSYNEKVDIYSYGLILYEALTGVTPYQEDCKDNFYIKVIYGNERPSFNHDELGNPIASIQSSKLFTMGMHVNENATTDGNEITKPAGYYLTKLKSFIQSCWHQDYTKRPTAKNALELFVALENIITNTQSRVATTLFSNEENQELMNVPSEDESFDTINAKSSTAVVDVDIKTNKPSMLISRGDFNWTKDSVSISTENISHTSMSRENDGTKMGSTITSSCGTSFYGIRPSYSYNSLSQLQTPCSDSKNPIYNAGLMTTPTNLKSTMSTSSMYSTSSNTDTNMTSPNNVSPVVYPTIKEDIAVNSSGEENGVNFLQRGYNSIVKHWAGLPYN